MSVFDSGLSPTAAKDLAAGAEALPLFTARSDVGQVTVLSATCAQAERALGAELRGCLARPTWLSDEAMPTLPKVSMLRAKPSNVAVPHVGVVHVPGLPGELADVLLVPPPVAAKLVTDPSSFGTVASVPTRAVDDYLARVSAVAPWAQTRTGDFEFSNPDQKLYTGTSRLVVLATWASLVLATLALISASLGEVANQRRRSHELDVLGAGDADFVRLHLTTTSAPILLAGGVASAISYVVGRSILHMDDRAVSPPAMYVAMILGSLLVAALAAAVTAPLATARRRAPAE